METTRNKRLSSSLPASSSAIAIFTISRARCSTDGMSYKAGSPARPDLCSWAHQSTGGVPDATLSGKGKHLHATIFCCVDPDGLARRGKMSRIRKRPTPQGIQFQLAVGSYHGSLLRSTIPFNLSNSSPVLAMLPPRV